MSARCTVCGAFPVVAEIEGRVLVCAGCRDDDALREHARKDWR